MDVLTIAEGKSVLLRDRKPSDVEKYIYWQTHGEWREFDAPWEGILSSITPEQEQDIRQRFLEKCMIERSVPLKYAIICTLDDEPIGWVSRYNHDRFPEVYFVGIDICEDRELNKGIGTETIDLWVGYLFTHSTVHKIALDTWSFNQRMIRVAEKAGFRNEGMERELIRWQGQWISLLHFGILRVEWEKQWKSD